MDLVHRPDERDEISEKIHLKTYFQEFRRTLEEGKLTSKCTIMEMNDNGM